MKLPLCAWLSVFLTLCASENLLEVRTNSGTVKGRTVSALDGKEVDAFLSIPYGAPTSGSNRFAPPTEVEQWTGVLDATSFHKPCYQVVPQVYRGSFWLTQNEESENCLRLNIWVPTPRPEKSPVMIWIHGGGFVSGSTDLVLYNGAALAAQENIIVASVNYRLSSFGFLYLGIPESPGNVGLMDQALGFKWIKNNIQKFGGDPERITIFGESAGALSVGYHLLAPTSLDLFRNAILQSGTPSAFFAYAEPEEIIENSLKLAGHAGCPDKKDKREEALRCLQKLSAEELLDLTLKVEDTPLKMVFRPVVDGKFVPSNPLEMLTKGQFCGEKNIIIGHTRDDGSNILPVKLPTLPVSEDAVYTEEHFETAVTEVIHQTRHSTPLEREVVKLIYTDWEGEGDQFSVRNQMVRFMTDRWFACPAISMADKLVTKGNEVYFYRFDHGTETREGQHAMPAWMGAAHGDEIYFLLGLKLKQNPTCPLEEIRLCKQMMRYWANFARKDDPNDELLPLWPKYTKEDKLRLHFDADGTTAKKSDRIRECNFWENSFPKIKAVRKDEL